MDGRRVCAPLQAEAEALSPTTTLPHGADTVINTNTDSNPVQAVEKAEELTNGLLTDDYCHVCDAVLLYRSQRLSHYEGKKHAQKLKVYLRTRGSERRSQEAAGASKVRSDVGTSQFHNVPADKERFCELCNMVFSSPVVAQSHYEGKVHTKHLRKQGLQPSVPVTDCPSEAPPQPGLSQDPATDVQKPSPEGDVETPEPRADVDVTDPHRYCPLCAASFNNPQMALQHYNGRKHQRNRSRHKMLKELGNKVQQDNKLICQLCGIQFDSVEMFQAHMQGNKHQVREKKVQTLCKSQQKVYHTFADELSDYIQIQKARGIAQKPVGLPAGATQRGGKIFPEREPNYQPPHPSCYNRSRGCPPSYAGLSWPPQGPPHGGSPPVVPGLASPLFPGHFLVRKRPRNEAFSSSDSSSCSSSSSSSSSSDSGDSKYRRRDKRRPGKSRGERELKATEEDSDKEEKRKKRRRRAGHKDLDAVRGGESAGSEEEERRRKGGKSHSWNKSGEKKTHVDSEAAAGESWKQEKVTHDRSEGNVEQLDSEQDESGKAKNKREKKNGKEDKRTEEEKLWDDSILGF